jgi:N-acetylglutamate synthase-like GNAT family acetyltransferase
VTPDDRADLYRRGVRFLHHVESRCTTRTIDWGWGTGYFNDTFPVKWDLNYLRLERDASLDDVPSIIEEADAVFAASAFKHRNIHLDDERGRELVEGFRDAGWETEDLLVMVHTGEVPDNGRVPVEEVPSTEIRPAVQEWYRSTLVVSQADLENLTDSITAVEQAVDVRYFAARSEGSIVSWCHLYSAGDVAQVEEVSTFPRYRNRGSASSVVKRAMSEAYSDGARLVFLVADSADWPKELYTKLGFETVGRIYEFRKNPQGAFRSDDLSA